MTQLQVNETQHLPLSLSYHDPLTHMLTASCLPSETNSVRVLSIPSLLGIAADNMVTYYFYPMQFKIHVLA